MHKRERYDLHGSGSMSHGHSQGLIFRAYLHEFPTIP